MASVSQTLHQRVLHCDFKGPDLSRGPPVYRQTLQFLQLTGRVSVDRGVKSGVPKKHSNFASSLSHHVAKDLLNTCEFNHGIRPRRWLQVTDTQTSGAATAAKCLGYLRVLRRNPMQSTKPGSKFETKAVAPHSTIHGSWVEAPHADVDKIVAAQS